MKTVQQIIETHGGLAALREGHISIQSPGYMRLVIEYVGQGPRGLPMVSVAHYGEQNGDAIRDPEIFFEVFRWNIPGPAGVWGWLPLSIQQDYLGRYQDITWREDGKLLTKPKLEKDVLAFSRTWDRNIKAQGFAEAAAAG